MAALDAVRESLIGPPIAVPGLVVNPHPIPPLQSTAMLYSKGRLLLQSGCCPSDFYSSKL